MFILIGVTLILKTKLTSVRLSNILTIFRVLLIISKGDFSLLVGLQINKGDWIMLGACILYAGYTIGLQNRPDIDNMTMMTGLYGAAWVLSIPILLIEVTQARHNGQLLN